MLSTSEVGIPLYKGLPSLLNGANPPDPDQVSRLVTILRRARTKLAENWVDACSGKQRHSTIVQAVDSCVSFVLLTEYIRRRDPDVLPALKELLPQARPLSARQLFAAAHRQAKSGLLKPVFEQAVLTSGLAMPTALRGGKLFADLADVVREAFPSGMPTSVFGTFRLLCFEDPIRQEGRRASPGRRVNHERHSRGIYYTPPALADYLTHALLEQLIDSSDRDPFGIRILDPACGCGAFLIAGLRYLLERLKRNDLERRGRKRKAHASDHRHLCAVLESLGSAMRGVDTDAQAVEWTRRCLHLVFWESTRGLAAGADAVVPLRAPNFGNTVIHADFLHEREATIGGDSFGSPDGVDAILGAPPFVRTKGVHAHQSSRIQGYRRMFRTARADQFDLYMLFVERAARHLKPGGLLGFSLSGSFLRSRSGKTLRDVLGREGRVAEIIEFESQSVYPECTSHICLLSFEKGRAQRNPRYAAVRRGVDVRAALAEVSRKKKSTGKGDVGLHRARVDLVDPGIWRFEPVHEARLLARLERAGTVLQDLPVTIKLGVRTGADDVLVLRRKSGLRGSLVRAERPTTREEHLLESAATRPLLRGRDLVGYRKPSPARVCVCPGVCDEAESNQCDIQATYPRTFKYLKAHRDVLRRIATSHRGPWYALKRASSPPCGPKGVLLSAVIAAEASFTVGRMRKTLCHQSVLIISPVGDWIDPYYLLGVLNSSVIWTYIRHRMPVVGPGRRAIRIGLLRQLPIPIPKSGEDARTCGRIAQLARNLMAADSPRHHRRRWRSEINRLVLALIGMKGGG